MKEMEQRGELIEEFSRCHAVLLGQRFFAAVFRLRRAEDSLNNRREQQRGTISNHPIVRGESSNRQSNAAFDVSDDIVGKALIPVERTNSVVRVNLVERKMIK